MKRLKTIIESKINTILNRTENPIETLDYAIQQQKEALIKVKAGIAEYTTSKKKLETRKISLTNEIVKLEKQAKDAMLTGNEPFAKIILERKAKAQQDVTSLASSIENMNIEQQKLINDQKQFELKIAELESTRETVAAEYTAAQSTLKIKQSLSGLNTTSAGAAVHNARDKTDEMKARSAAITELSDAGVLDDPTGASSIDRELERAALQNSSDAEFKKMKRQMMVKRNDLRVFNK